VSPTTAQAVSAELEEYLQPEDQILDGGSSLVGVESTIIDCSKENPSILRPGAVTAEMVEQSTGIIILEAQEPRVRASGSHKQHYSPKARVLIGKEAQSGDGLIAMEGVLTPDGANRLASPKNNEEYARILYSALRQGDDAGLARIYIDPPKGLGLAVAIRDRITRASSS
ncbi:MAG: threonylcarbamoyl-AMP synthase, partial [Actinobacteria bacterium]|nr:threonylcarbamoyl-AMP synthase [Candidatus Fonsibacter lacus]